MSQPTENRDQPRSFFTTPRERRLWLAAFIVIMTIYAMLGLASKLAKSLYNQEFSAGAFLLCMGLIGIMVLTQGLRVRPKGIEVGIGLGIAAVYLMVFLRLTVPERSHLIEYSVVAVLLCEALRERSSHGRWVPKPPLLAILTTSLIGALDELIQLFLPSRHFDWTDILFNFLASVMAVISLMALGWVRSITFGP